MNPLAFDDAKMLLAHRLRIATRFADLRRRADVFSTSDDVDALRRIYVINLDRKPKRWQRQQREIDRFRDRRGQRLSQLTRRFSAIDARYLGPTLDESTLSPSFSLAEQLMVDPDPRLKIDDATFAHEIRMTPQEIAVALSHIEVWKLVAHGDVSSALILEDDVVFTRGFARKLRETWITLTGASGDMQFDLLYLAYRELRPSNRRDTDNAAPTRRNEPGLWEASGYVLTRAGAQRLLDRLPAHGPIDLWLNLQFHSLRVYSAADRLIEQRLDEPSTNSYSVLPALSKAGLLTREKPLVHTAAKLPEPVIAMGPTGSGLTALATALSMLGYTCLSDLGSMPQQEKVALETKKKHGAFNAYVNIGSLADMNFAALAATNPRALFISTTPYSQFGTIPTHRHLSLDPHNNDKWAAVSRFLGVDYPSLPYPDDIDLGRRSTTEIASASTAPTHVQKLRADVSPWILRSGDGLLRSFHIVSEPQAQSAHTSIEWTSESPLDSNHWILRNDTFPSNLALFSASNYEQSPCGPGVLHLRPERTAVRKYTSAAIASQETYMYGTFGAELRSSNVSGLITGLFLHRNGPRQEIDIEFLGKDTTKMLANVYYNPGPEGARMEYGFRGTPVLIDLGFDSAADFHRYEIEWYPDAIRWKVDGEVLHERTRWNPTPIPNRPLEFNFNLWYSRSEDLAGRLASSRLPAAVELRSIMIRTPAKQRP